MIPEPIVTVTGIIARSSIGFVSTVFRLYAERRPFVVVASSDAAGRIEGLRFDELIDPEAGSGWFIEQHATINDPALAQISFTSGTTGQPKGIMLSYSALADTIARLNCVMRLDSSVREYVGVPPNYSFGLGRFRAIAAVGGRAYISPRGFDPAEIVQMLRDGEINAVSAVPTQIRLLLERGSTIGDAGSAMRWIEIGSQPLARREKEELKRLFPAATIVQHYGLTEASRSAFLTISENHGMALDSVGVATGEAEIAIASDGRIRIRGPHVAQEWIDGKGRYRLTDEDGWLTTNDLGSIHEGRLFFGGRADDLINCGGIKLVPDIVEERLRERLAVAGGIAVARVPDATRGDGVLVAVERAAPLSLDDVRVAAVAVISSFGLAPGSALHVLNVERLPTTDTGKVQRSRLTEEVVASGVLDERAAAETGTSTEVSALRTELAHNLGVPSIEDDDSFVRLGGDSLSYIRVSLLIEERLGYLPDGWEAMPIATLEAMLPAKKRGSAVETSIPVRALAILIVVFDHAWAQGFGNASPALLMVAGLNFSRFQVPKILRGRARDVLMSVALRILLPYYVFVTVTLAYHKRFFWPQYALVANFTEGVYSSGGDKLLVPYWFMEDYLLLVGLFSATLSVKMFGRFFERQRWESMLSLFIGALLVGIIARYNRELAPFKFFTIFSMGWLFVLGWLIYLADRPLRKAATVALGSVGLWVIAAEQLQRSPLTPIKMAIFLGMQFGALILLVYVQRLTLPRWLVSTFAVIATASLYIYMSHPFVLHVISQKGPLLPAVIAVLCSAVVGIGIARISEMLTAFVQSRRRGSASAAWSMQHSTTVGNDDQ